MSTKIHLAAQETFAQDGVPTCGADRGKYVETPHGFLVTHRIAEVTCARCLASKEMRRARRLGLTDNDETWAETIFGD